MLHREKATDAHKPRGGNMGPFYRLSAALRRQLAMPSAHQGSALRLILGRTSFHLRRGFKSIVRRLRDRLSGARRSDLRNRLAKFEQHIMHNEWGEAHREAVEIGNIAEQQRDAALMRNMSRALEKLRGFPEAARLRLATLQIARRGRANDWAGEDIHQKTLLIDFWRQSIKNEKLALGQSIRCARLIALAAARTKHCIVVVEPRLVPIFQRTFPHVDVRPGKEEIDTAYADADIIATTDHLVAFFATDEAAIAATFSPLRADPELAQTLRQQYRGTDDRPLIGLSWASKTYLKEVPSLEDWTKMLGSLDAKFVSLQYGNIAADLRELRRSGADIIYDESVDQLSDMDRFASQIAALDAVVSISNSAAHLTGALGTPAVFLLDDTFHRYWPVIGDTIPWYPNVRLVRKNSRPWADAIEEVRTKLVEILEQSKPQLKSL